MNSGYAVYIEEQPDSSLTVYCSDNTRWNISPLGELVLKDSFPLPKPDFEYAYEQGMLKRQNPQTGELIWEKAVFHNFNIFNYTHSGMVYLIYQDPNALNSYAFLEVYNSDGELVHEMSKNGPQNVNTIRFSYSLLDGSAVVSSSSGSGWRPQGAASSSYEMHLLDPDGEMICSKASNTASVWDNANGPNAICLDSDNRCRTVNSFRLGNNMTAPPYSGDKLPCLSKLYPYGFGSGIMLSLRNGGFAILAPQNNEFRLTKIKCGEEVPFTRYFSLKFFEDLNQNCILDNGEPEISDLPIFVDSTRYLTSRGLQLSDEEHLIELDSTTLADWFTCEDFPLSASLENTNFYKEIPLIRKDSFLEDLVVDVGAASFLQCDTFYLDVLAKNKSIPFISNGTLEIQLDSSINYINSEPPPLSLSGNKLTFPLEPIPRNEEIRFKIKVFGSCESIDRSFIEIPFEWNLRTSSQSGLSYIPVPDTTSGIFELITFPNYKSKFGDYDLVCGNQKLTMQMNFKNLTNDTIKTFNRLTFTDSFDPQIIKSSIDVLHHNFTLSQHDISGVPFIILSNVIMPPFMTNPINGETYVKFTADYVGFSEDLLINEVGVSNNIIINASDIDTALVGYNVISIDTIHQLCEEKRWRFKEIEIEQVNFSSCNVNVKINKYNFFPSHIDTFEVETCFRDTVNFMGMDLVMNGSHWFIEHDQNGCDSGFVVVPLYFPLHRIKDTIYLAPDEEFQNQTFQSDTLLSQLYQSQDGCDSTHTYDIRILTNNQETSHEMSQIEVFPNPVQSELQIKYYAKRAETYQLNIIDPFGKSLIKQTIISRKGENLMRLKTKKLPQGFYFIQFENQKIGFRQKGVKFIKM